jgi:hypothetical protein
MIKFKILTYDFLYNSYKNKKSYKYTTFHFLQLLNNYLVLSLPRTQRRAIDNKRQPQ